VSQGLAPAALRRDDALLARLRIAATWLCGAAGLGLLGLLPEGAGSTGLGGLGLLLLLAPWAAKLGLVQLRRAPALVAPAGILLAWLFGLDLLGLVAGGAALLLVTETASAAAAPPSGRVPLFTLLAALLCCTHHSSALLAPMLLLAGLSGACAMLLGSIGDCEGAPRSGALVRRGTGLGLTGLLAVLAAASVLAFLALPRHPGRAAAVPAPTHRLVGYAEQVRLGELAGALRDPTPLFRVRVESPEGGPIPGPFHFRGVVLDSFDGRVWSATAPAGQALLEPEQASAPLVQHFLFEPTAPPILVGVPRLEAISVPPEELVRAPSGTLLHRDGPRVHGYQAWSRPDRWSALDAPGEADAVEPPPLFLALPTDIDPAILALARQATEGEDSPTGRAQALLELMQGSYHYEQLPSGPMGDAPLESFLLHRKRGHCELFATALAVLLRAVEVPSRVVNGFYGGDYNPVGGYWLLRHADAHAWVEAWLPEQGWVSLDPTPPATTERIGLASALGDHAATQWTHRVLSLDAQAQIEALTTPGAALRSLLEPPGPGPSLEPPNRTIDLVISLAMVAAALLGMAQGWRRLSPWLAGERSREAPRGEVERSLRAGLRLLRRRGWHPPPHLPPRSAARWLRAAAGPAAEPFATLARLHYRVRYAGDPDAVLAAEARAALRDLRALPTAPNEA
jgi:transglutaminase-like putative cysteine protease